MAQGIIKRYDFRKGFGFIADDKTGEDFFFHKSEWQGDEPIRRGAAVKYVEKSSEKGPHAESVVPLNGGSSKASKPSGKKTAPATPVKPASLEDRIASLESSVGMLKVVSFLALAGVVALAVERFVF